MSFQRIFQLLVACGAAVETQHVERRHHPQKKFGPYSRQRNRIMRRGSSRFWSDSRWHDSALPNPAEAFGDKGSRRLASGRLA
jgi:hypothetical protein